MGVQRKSAQVNWLASFGLIIFAGTLYRLRKVNNTIFKTQMTQLMQKLGHRLNWHQQRTILRQQSPLKKGQWQQIKLQSNHYRYIMKQKRLCQTVYNIASRTQTLFFSNKKK